MDYRQIKIYVLAVFIALTILLFFCTSVVASSTFDLASLDKQSFVNDQANLFSTQDKLALEDFLQKLEQNSTLEFAVVTVSSLNGSDIFDISLATAEYLGVGKSDVDNGLLLFISLQDRRILFKLAKGLKVLFRTPRLLE